MAAANTEVEALDFEYDDEDLMDYDPPPPPPPLPLPPALAATADSNASTPKLRSAITASGADAPRKTKGRGFRDEASTDRSSRLAARNFNSLSSDGGPGPQRSIEGWIILVTGLPMEAQEVDVHNVFGEFGHVKNLNLINLDRRTGFVKGYALIEYENYEEAETAIKTMDGTQDQELFDQTVHVDWAFSKGPAFVNGTAASKRRSPRRRSRTPPRRHY